jgi:predicted transcriptional regulator
MPNPEEFISNDMKNVSDVYQVKILIAYFLSRINQLCTPNQLTEIATGEGIVNYFTYTEAVSAMLENGTLELAEIDGTEYYRLTEKGLEGADSFKKQVSKSFRDKIYAAGLRLFTKLKNDKDVVFDITPTNKGYNVHCKCCDGDLVLMDLNIFAPDMEQAKFLKSKIMMNPTDFYCKIVDYIIENEEYVPSVAEDEPTLL